MQRISHGLFLFLLIFSPLAFGTVENWSRAVLEAGAALSFLLLTAHVFLQRKTAMEIPGIAPLLLLTAFMALQLLPLPGQLVKVISPAAFEISRPYLELKGGSGFLPLTVHRKSTLLALFNQSACVLMYILTVCHCSREEPLRRTVAVVVWLGVLIAVEAVLQKLTSPDAVYWFRPTVNASPVGPWVYANHFAGYMEMVFPLAIALFLYHRPRIDYGRTAREKFIYLLTMPGANRSLLLATGAMVMAVSILLSVSRGGIITLCAAFLFFTLFSARVTSDARIRWSIVLTAAVVLMATWLGWQPIIDKFGRLWGDTGLNTSGRLPVLLDSIRLFRSFPATGSGFGTFHHVYPAVRTVPGDAVFDHAHNDYMELLAGGGLIGFLLCAWFVLAVLIHTLGRLRRRRERYSILLTSGALTGMLALLFHCLADFQMANGANALYFFLLGGLAVSAVNTRLTYRSRPTLLERRDARLFTVPLIIAVMLLTGSIWYRFTLFRAETVTAPLHTVYLNRHIPVDRLRQMHTTLVLGSRFDPLEAGYPYRLGHVSSFLGDQARARREYLRACLLQPTSGEYVQQLGMALTDDGSGRRQALLLLGLQREPLVAERYLACSEWLLANDLRDEACAAINLAIFNVPWRMPDLVDYLFFRRFSTDEIERTLPPLPQAWHLAGRRMEKKDRLDEAERYYRKTLDHLGGAEILPAYFSRLHNLYRRQQKEETALEILRLGIRYLPDHAPFRVLLGDHYLEQDIPYRAAEEYREALRLDPRNHAVRRKLADIDQQGFTAD